LAKYPKNALKIKYLPFLRKLETGYLGKLALNHPVLGLENFVLAHWIEGAHTYT
jgi:hypothetical protein